MKLKLLPLFLLSSIAVEAQHPVQRQPRERVSPPPAHGQVHPADPESALVENITLKITGKTPDGISIDFAMTGTGPAFQLDQAGENHSFITHQHQVRRTDNRYMVTYSIGLRIRIETARNGDSVNYEFRDVVLRSTALCEAGEPMIITRTGENELTLVVEETGKRRTDGAEATDEAEDPPATDVDKVEESDETTDAAAPGG